ncbi:MAG: hypothetical protein QXL18_02835 [Candidatus Woesearchaeota archaeon]
MKKHTIEDILFDKKNKINEEYVVIEKISHEFTAFTIEYLPKNFNKVSKKEINFNRQSIKKRQIPNLKKFFNSNVYLEIECYLTNQKVSIEDIIKFVFSVITGIAFRNKNNVKGIKVEINDTKKDPYNRGQNFIGITIKKFQEKKFPDKIILQP